ncbi:plasmid mobilization protein [Flavitalea flava]
MTKITGRPPRVIKQEKHIGFFVTNAQYSIIQQKTKETGMNISDYMRHSALYAVIKPRWTEEERGFFKDLIRVSNQLGQLGVIAKKEGILEIMPAFQRCRDQIDETINRFFHEQ